MDYISTKEALAALNIKSLNQLNILCKKHNIKKVCLGAGKGNVFDKQDIIRATKERVQIKKEKEVAKIEIKKNSQPKTQPTTILEEIGLNEYARVKSILIDKGTYEDIDDTILQSYAIAYQNYFSYSFEITKREGIDIDLAGGVRPTIYINMQNVFFKQMTECAKILGIGTLNRQKLDIKERVVIDEMSELIS